MGTETAPFGTKLYTQLAKHGVYDIYVGRDEYVSGLSEERPYIVPSGHFFNTEAEQRMFAQFVNLSEGSVIVRL